MRPAFRGEEKKRWGEVWQKERVSSVSPLPFVMTLYDDDLFLEDLDPSKTG